MIQKKKKPSFNVPNFGFFKSVKARWRKPRGTANKKRMKYKWFGALPKIGYRNASVIRGIHPSGKKEALIHSMTDLLALNGVKDVVLRFASGIGMRKRKILGEKAKSMNLKVLNMGGAEKGEGKKTFTRSMKKPGAKAAEPQAQSRKTSPGMAAPAPKPVAMGAAQGQGTAKVSPQAQARKPASMK